MPVAFDTNVLIYAELEPGTIKGALAGSLIKRGAAGGAIIAAQVIGEFLAVTRRKRPERFPGACELALDLPTLFRIPPTDAQVMCRAVELVQRHRLQSWDAVICAASLEAGATHLLSEDMQNGLVLMSLTIVDPFDPSNRPLLERLLPATASG